MKKIILDAARPGASIAPELYGNFSEHLGRCIYGGVYVGEDSPIPHEKGIRQDVVEALRRMALPVLRWPGGCFADEYHWQDGVGPKSSRKRMVNTNWGGVVEDNSFGTHEFMELCRQVGCKSYINGNVGSGTVREMAEWVEYMTFPGQSPMADLRRANGREEPWQVDYFGVGNENWGCGGQMRPEYYADLYRRYQCFIKNFGPKPIYKVACGAGTSPEAPNYDWTEVLMKQAGPYMDGLSLHYYTVPGEDWNHKGSATVFSEQTYYDTLERAYAMDMLITRHGRIMDRYDPEGRVGMIVDEWGTWYDVEPGTHPGFLYQQNTMRDALVAGLTLNLFNRHCQRVRMANIAQMVNVLQAVILTDGPRMILTPTYHVFELYKGHQGARLLPGWDDAGLLAGALPELGYSASLQDQGLLTLTVCNPSASHSVPVETLILGGHFALSQARVLTGPMGAFNDFETGSPVAPQPLAGAAASAHGGHTKLTFTLPPVSVAALTLQA